MNNYPPPIQKIIDKHIGTHIDRRDRVTYFFEYSLPEFVQELVYSSIKFGFEQGKLKASAEAKDSKDSGGEQNE